MLPALRNLIHTSIGVDPTNQQDGAIEKLLQFTFSTEINSLFVLSGYAGTGKTTLVGAYIKALGTLKIKSVLLAPTGRAAKVLASKSKRQVFTIHKKIYRRKLLAGGISVLELSPNLHKNTVFIIDEASMIGEYMSSNEGSGMSRNLLSDVLEYVFSGDGCKLIFVGDEGQLPPVGSDYSPALDLQFLKNLFLSLSISDARLTEVVRQSLTSDILLNASKLRYYKGVEFPKIHTSKKGDVVRLNGDQLQEYLESSYDKFGFDEVIIITKSNKRTNAYNQNVRNRILYREEEICSGDRLMVVRNNYFWLEETSEAGFIANGEIIKLNRVVKTVTLYGFEFIHVLAELVDFPQMGDFETIIMVETLHSETPSLSRDRLKALFYAIEQDYSYERNKKKRYELVVNNPYFNALQVKYAYAITCHKAQGGQWPVVFLDHDYLKAEMLDASFFRWLYTGFTRASEQLFLVNFHADFFEKSFDEG